MKKRSFIGTIILSVWIGLTSTLQAEVAYTEQILAGNGGVSVSLSGEWAAVGAYDASDNLSCYVTMYRLDHATMTWNLHSTLGEANGNCKGNKGFGSAISLSGVNLVVGISDYTSGNDKLVGAFSAFEYDSALDEWALLVGPVIADDPQEESGFGTAVSIQSGILVVGAPKYNGAAGMNTGKIYLYERPAGIISTLTPTVTVEGNQTNSRFGSAVAGDDRNIIIGASGYDQGGFTDNGAGFLYHYDPTVPSLTLGEALYGTADNESLGVQIVQKGIYALISGNLRTYGYHYDGTMWQRDLTQESTGGGDVSVDSSVSAVGTIGTSVNVYPSIKGSYNSHFISIAPSGAGQFFAEDLSLSENMLLVSESDRDQARMYQMPCGFGGTLSANEWAMVSIPCKISGQSVATIFGDDGLGTYDVNWVVYEQNASNYSGKSVDAIKLNESSPVVQGKSYWIVADSDVTWKVDATVSTTRTDLNTTLVPYPDVSAGVYAIALPAADQELDGNTSWAKVMLGNPFASMFEWMNVQYNSAKDGNISLDMAEASNYMNATAYVYDSSVVSGQPYEAVHATPGFNRPVGVNEGFWIKMLNDANASDQLLIPLQK